MKRTALLLSMVSLAAFSSPLASSRAAEKEAPATPAAEVKPAADEPAVDPEARAILKRAVDFLAGAGQFSVSVEIWEDIVLENGSTAQYAKVAAVKLRRPDRLQVDVTTTSPKRSFFYDGTSLSILDRQKNFYGTIAVPPTLDAMLNKASEAYGIDFPLEDLLLSRPFGDGAAAATAGEYLGPQNVLGTLCHHLAFRSETVDWQLWIQDGPVPVIRKALLAGKEDGEGPAGVTFLFSGWDTTTALPDFIFSFQAPAGTTKVELLPAPADPAPAAGTPETTPAK